MRDGAYLLPTGEAHRAALAADNARLYVEAQAEITARRHTEAQLRASLREKEILLKEVHHRVKNNLQTISSLLNLQSASITDAGALEAVRESQSRVRSMALIHQKLYQGDQLAGVEMKDYFTSMGQAIRAAYAGQTPPVDIKTEMAATTLDVDTAIPLGLIVNELLTNAFKYAFNGQSSGTINIHLSPAAEGGYRLYVADNGRGAAALTARPEAGFGSRLVKLLTLQLGGRLEESHQNGWQTTIHFQPVTSLQAA
ncbi:MAG: sensor histidine kinase [Lewinella sp.]|nr:sensor histidine kinase [Lewinella sp.]